MNKKMQITIKGAYGATNFGDDLLMLLFEDYLSTNFKDATLNFIGNDVAKYPNKLLKSSSSFNKEIKSVDWFIYGGGTQFFSFQNKTKSDSTIRKLVNLIAHPKILLTKLNKKIFKNKKKSIKPNHISFLGFGLGPFSENQEVIRNVQQKLNEADFIGLRDYQSVSYCEQWNIKSHFGADMAFSSYFDKYYKHLDAKSRNLSERKKIGIIVRDWIWEETGGAYENPVLDLYKSENKNMDVQFIVFAPFKDPQWIEKLKEKNALIWDPSKYTVIDFLNILNSFDSFISARFHGAIVGALLGKPVIAIEIEPKLRILTEDIKEISLWKKPFDIASLNFMIQNINYEVNYKKSLQSLRLRADRVLNEFITFVNNTNYNG